MSVIFNVINCLSDGIKLVPLYVGNELKLIGPDTYNIELMEVVPFNILKFDTFNTEFIVVDPFKILLPPTYKKEFIETLPFNILVFDTFNIELIKVEPEIFNDAKHVELLL